MSDCSGLMISPSGTEYTITSSNQDTVAVEQVPTFWVAIAKAERTVEITAYNSVGEQGLVTLTVGFATPANPAGEDSASRADNIEIRQEMIWLINQPRRTNGVLELPVSEVLMNAAQARSDRRYTWHHTKEECEDVATTGYLYGFGDNFTVFSATADAAQHAVDSWINSSGHFQTMIAPDCDRIGIGVTQHDGVTCYYMFVEIPNSVIFYR